MASPIGSDGGGVGGFQNLGHVGRPDPAGEEVMDFDFDPWAEAARRLRAQRDASSHPSEQGNEAWTQWGSQWWNEDSTWKWSRGEEDRATGGGRDDDPPEWDGKSVPLIRYLRLVEIWRSHTRTNLTRQGPKMLGRLTGDAFEKTELVDPSILKTEEGAQTLINYLKDKYEPIEHRKVGKIMDDFMFSFDRKYEEEIQDYDTRFDKELSRAEAAAGQLSPMWKAHLYLKKMKLGPEKESLVLTGALGKYTIPALRAAALSVFPSMSSFRRDRNPAPHGGSHGGYQARGKFQRKGFRPGQKKPHRAHEAHVEERSESSDQDMDGSPLFEDEEGDDDEASEGEEVDLPEELRLADEETKAYMTQAKKQRADVEKARGFYRKGSGKGGGKGKDATERTEYLKKLKARLPCAVCGALGHWKDDPECPKRKSKDRSSYMVQVSNELVATDTCVLVDTACAKTVAGRPWADKIREIYEQRGAVLKQIPESEPFRFGPGRRILSRCALLVPCSLGGVTLVLRVSIVERDVPCLLSRRALKSLGAIINFDDGNMVLKRVGSDEIDLIDVPSGHVAIDLLPSDVTLGQVSEEAWLRLTGPVEVTLADGPAEHLSAPAVVHECSIPWDIPDSDAEYIEPPCS